jgi:TrpR family trp operon transcriptional repressor
MKNDMPPLDEEALVELSAKIAEMRSAMTVRKLLDELLTPAERRDLALRWRLLRLLANGVPQRRIAADLGVSLCKITRGSGVLKKTASVCQSILKPEPPSPEP